MNKILPKKALRSLNTYRPAVAEKKTKDVVRLSVNEGALGPSPNAIKAIKEWSLENHLFHRYPDQIDQGLINAIANRYKLIQENIVLGNGSDDLIQLICNAFIDPGDEAIHTEYGFLVFAALWGWVLWSTVLGLSEVIGITFIIVAGIIIITRSARVIS